MSRFERQRSLVKQEKLLAAKIAVVGSGPIATSMLLGLFGLGIGTVYRIGTNGLNFVPPTTKLLTYGTFDEFSRKVLEKSKIDIIVDASNDPYSKYNTLRYAEKIGINTISASCDELDLKAVLFTTGQNHDSPNEFYMKDYQNKRQGVIAGIAAAHVLEWIRKSYDGAECFHVRDNSISFSYQQNQERRRHKNILIAGCGGVGTFAAIALGYMADSNASLTIFDPDTIALDNLSNQVLFKEEDTGKPKIEVFVARLEEIFPNLKGRINGICNSLGVGVNKREGIRGSELEELIRRHDFIIGCTDNIPTKYALAACAKVTEKPLTDGGVEITAESRIWKADLYSYLPGKTGCMLCQQVLTKGEADSSATEMEGCGTVLGINPRIIIPDMILGTLHALQACYSLPANLLYSNKPKQQIEVSPSSIPGDDCELNCGGNKK